MAQEQTLKNAIKWSKNQVVKYGFGNFPRIEDIWQIAKDIYYLREDEKKSYFESMKKTFGNDPDRCRTAEEEEQYYKDIEKQIEELNKMLQNI